MSDEIRSLVVTEEDRLLFKRLDLFLVSKLNDISRSLIKKIFDNDDITSPLGTKLELKKMPLAGTIIEIDIPPPLPTDIKAQNIPLEILYEDEWLIIINKKAGMCVHPAPGHPDQTLVNAILFHCPDLKGIGQEKRPGIVHRLDLGTSGVMVVAKEQKTHEELVTLFSTHDIEREYIAILWGKPTLPKGRIETFYGRHPVSRLKMSAELKAGKKAITHYELIKYHEKYKLSLMNFRLETGRTHQIRVHASQILRTPLLNDALYADVAGQKNKIDVDLLNIFKDYPYPFLHAKVLGFIHPKTKQALRFETLPPEQFTQVMDQLLSSVN